MAGLLSQPPADAVAAELRRWASEPFVWGRTDCGLSILAYAERIRGQRFSPWPAYRNARGAYSMLARAGGYIAYFVETLGAIGCPETDEPGLGDVGLVELDTGLTACLCLGDSWAARGAREIIILPAEAIVACEVRCPRP